MGTEDHFRYYRARVRARDFQTHLEIDHGLDLSDHTWHDWDDLHRSAHMREVTMQPHRITEEQPAIDRNTKLPRDEYEWEVCRREMEAHTAEALRLLDDKGRFGPAQVHATLALAWATRGAGE